MKRLFFGLLILLAIGSVGLSTYTAPTTAGGNVASANGSGHNGDFTLSFGAFDHGEGNFTGQATFINDAANSKVTLDVECLSVSVNIATVGGTVLKSNDPGFAPGSGGTFSVVDNGEGTGAIPDAFTSLNPGGCGAAESMIPVPMSSDSGNIQVRFVAPDKDCMKCPAGTHCAGNGECAGGGGSHCKTGYKDCCGTCILEGEGCMACEK